MFFEALLLFLTLVFGWHFYNRPRGMPPGPTTYPFIGSGIALQMAKIRQYRKQYGDIFRCEIASIKFVYICDFKLMKEALNKIEFADRPKFPGLHILTEGKEAGIVMSNGQRWQNARRFLLRNLRDLGMGKSNLDDVIVQEAKFLVEDFKNNTGKLTKLPKSIDIAVLNVLWQMIASRRYDLHDKEICDYINLLKTLQDDTSGFFILEALPCLKIILPRFVKDKFLKMEVVNKAIATAKKLFKDIIDFRKVELEPDQAENVIDEYLIQMDQQSEVSQYFNESDLMKTIMDLFSAGYDTTANTLRWVCLYAAKYPEVQQRVQQQIDEVVPRDSCPSWQHKTQLPLVEAFINEVLRLTSLVPLGVVHATNSDTYLAGYYIPKGSIVFGVSGICHEDPNYWVAPHEFRIQRFLDEEGRFVSHKEGFSPFGVGKRSCLGESLARMELSIFTASLLQNFTILPPEGQQVDLEPRENVPLGHFPKDQNIVISLRD